MGSKWDRARSQERQPYDRWELSENFSISQQQTDVITKTEYKGFQVPEEEKSFCIRCVCMCQSKTSKHYFWIKERE